MKIILVRLYYLNKVIQVSLVSLVKFFRLDYIDSICLVKWQGLAMLTKLS